MYSRTLKKLLPRRVWQVAKDKEVTPAFQQESLLSVYLGASYEDGAFAFFLCFV